MDVGTWEVRCEWLINEPLRNSTRHPPMGTHCDIMYNTEHVPKCAGVEHIPELVCVFAKSWYTSFIEFIGRRLAPMQ